VATQLSIANQALAIVGNTTLSALADNTDVARKCTLLLPVAIQEVSRAGKWRALRKRADSTIEAWVTATAYTAYDSSVPTDADYVTQGGVTYICLVSHTSGTFATDLAALKWAVATNTIALAAAQQPLTGWDFAYTLPADFLRIVSYNEIDVDDVLPELFSTEKTLLLSNDDEVTITYVADVSASADPAITDPALNELFALKLATKLSWALQQENTERNALLQEYGFKLQKALSLDSRQGKAGRKARTGGSRWVVDRLSGTNG
jgi:hypothetical protein